MTTMPLLSGGIYHGYMDSNTQFLCSCEGGYYVSPLGQFLNCSAK